jgi:hypothetical protein
MRRELLILSLILTMSVGLFACGGSTDTPKDSTPTPASKDAGGTKAAGDSGGKTSSANASPWGGFKAGSFVKLKTTSSVEVMGKPTETSTESKMTLAELTADKAIVDIEMTVMGHTTKTRQEFPLSGSGATPTATPGTSQPKMGTDTLSVAGKTINCKTIEVDSEAAGSKINSKTWMSDQVPGGMVKSVSSTTGATTSKTTVEVVDFQAN